MKNIVEKIIQQRNGSFQLDSAVTNRVLFSLILEKGNYFIRGLRRFLHLKNPKMLMLGRRVKFFYPSNMVFGKWVKIEDNVYLNALGKGKLRVGNNVGIGANSRVIISTSFNNIGSHIKIGDNVGIGEFAYLGGGGGLEIGNNCIIGQYLSCHPENHNFENPEQLIREQGVTRKGIKIGNNCWIGAKVTVLDGVTIGDNCVIAAGAIITKSMPPNSVIGGVPAKVIKTIHATLKEVA